MVAATHRLRLVMRVSVSSGAVEQDLGHLLEVERAGEAGRSTLVEVQHRADLVRQPCTEVMATVSRKCGIFDCVALRLVALGQCWPAARAWTRSHRISVRVRLQRGQGTAGEPSRDVWNGPGP
jgi:hypothetical protein